MALPCILFVLSAEMLYMILAQLSTAQLLVFSHVSRQCRAITIREWSYRFRVLVTPFTEDMGLFEVLLDKYHVYVTGSIALAFINWGDFRTTHSDLDLYVPTPWAKALLVHLVSEEEYRLVHTKALRHDSFQYQTLKLMEFKKGDRTIHVIPVTGSLFADSAIPSVWTTALMNVVTPLGFYSAYPKLTFAKKGVINGPYLDLDGMPEASVIRLLNKYVRRGYDIRCSHLDWASETNPQVSCTGDAVCPRFPRRADDQYALRIPFTSLKEAYDRDEADKARHENVDAVAWMLGGADYVNGTNLSCIPSFSVANTAVVFSIIGIVCRTRFFHTDGAPRRHVSLRVVPRDPEDLLTMRRYLRTCANPPLSSVSAHTQSLEAFKDMKVRLSIHGRARIEPFKDVYEGFNRYGLHWEMPMVAPQSIQAGDLVVMECRMVRDDIPGSNHTKWRTRLELMAVTLAVKYGHRAGDRSQDDIAMSSSYSEEV
ncbi:hypothetical protein NM688_g562 [Phlebia brevispora]|uniref:Uncharacterized protein n=1 Tax=Phlebia brevispora TaxID=194682 RepID=A0ACC1TES9_9APHY|nr:hypothetical protein NM688_g562 [Phlebia brevispora]